MENIKVVLVGDAKVGKSSIISACVPNEFPPEFIGYVHGQMFTLPNVEVDGKEFNLKFYDTIPNEDYANLRIRLWYPISDVFLLCFSIDSPTSLANVESEWLPEVRRICPSTPIILLGTKLDLRHENEKLQEGTIKIEEGEEMAKKIGAVKYFECSALNKEGLKEILEAVARGGSDSQKKKPSSGFLNSMINFFRKLKSDS